MVETMPGTTTSSSPATKDSAIVACLLALFFLVRAVEQNNIQGTGEASLFPKVDGAELEDRRGFIGIPSI